MVLSDRPMGVADPWRGWGDRRPWFARERRAGNRNSPHGSVSAPLSTLRVGDREDEVAHMTHVKIIIEKHQDGYVAYPVGIKGEGVGQGESYEEALTDEKA